MFELHRVFLVSARMCKVRLEKCLYTRTHTTNRIAHPLEQGLEGQRNLVAKAFLERSPRPG